jgi:integrase
LDEGATAGTVRREWQVLNRILNVAVRYEKLDRNPLKHVELPDAEKRTRIAEPEELSLISKMRENDPTKLECRQELWRIIQVAVSVGLREGKILEIERSWIKKREDGYWLCLPPAASRIKGTPQEVPLNRTAMLALGAEIPLLPMVGSFAVGLTSGHLRNIGVKPVAGSGFTTCIFMTCGIRSQPDSSASVWITKSVRRSWAIACPA